MDSSSVLQKLKAREKVLRKARRFQRLLATDPTPEQAQRLLTASRRFVQPLGDNLVVEGGLDSKLLEVDEATMSAGCVISAIRRDRHGDVVRPKGCLKTLADYQKNPRVFFAHKSNDMPVGSCRKPGSDQIDFTVRDDDILSRCYFHGKTQESEDVFELVACRQIEAASIGFFPLIAEVIEGRFDPNEEVLDLDMGGLDFLEWSIIEWSWVPVPANPDALRSHLESTRGQKMSKTVRKAIEPFAAPLKKKSQVSFASTCKGAIPYAHHECAPEGQSWDGPAEVKKATPEQLKAMCAWYDADKPESKSSYKLPHHTADGCKTVWAGVHAAMSALLGGRGGTNIPASEKHAVYSHLKKHYEDFGKDAPDFHTSIDPDATKDLSSSVDPTNYSGSPDVTNLDQATGQTNEEPQAIIFHTTRFHSVKDCQAWLLENGYDPNSEIYEGDEADEPFVAVQFPSEECLLDTARRESIEDGVDIVFCVCKEKPDVADNLHESDEQTPIDSPNASNPPAPAQQASVTPAITKDFDDTSERYDSLEPPTDPDHGEAKPMPYGAELCKAMHGHLCSATEYLEKAMEVLDHPKVKSHMEGLHKALMGHAAKIKAMACSLYPEHFEGDGDESGPGDDDSDYGAKSLALFSEQKGLLHQVSETLTELADEPASLKKSQKTLARLHAQQLQKLSDQVVEVSQEVPQLTQKNSPARPLEVAKDPWDTPEVQEVLAGLLERQKALFQDLYAVTGKEVPGV